MNELYWFTRLESINFLSGFFAFFSGIALLAALTAYITGKVIQDDISENLIPVSKASIKICTSILVMSLLIHIFVPTTKEAFAIWGIGRTIDYLKSNKKAMQLPDNCIDALDKFISEYETDNYKPNNNKEE